MWILLGAVLSASLVGSMHCVGMCGPLAIWASGAAERQRSRQMMSAVALYHLGRLVTYTLVGFAAGALGQLADWGGETLGVQLLAARVVGGLMIIIGGAKLLSMLKWRMLELRSSAGSNTAAMQGQAGGKLGPLSAVANWITGSLVRLRPYIFQLPIPARGLVTGLLTALLPCGWLYLFALLAAGTGSALAGGLVMSAFWLGSVPALVALVSGLQFLSSRFRQLIPAAAALLMIAAGITTTSGRGFANLGSLRNFSVNGLQSTDGSVAGTRDASERLANSVDELVKTPLPCCAAKNESAEGAKE